MVWYWINLRCIRESRGLAGAAVPRLLLVPGDGGIWRGTESLESAPAPFFGMADYYRRIRSGGLGLVAGAGRAEGLIRDLPRRRSGRLRLYPVPGRPDRSGRWRRG